MATASVTNTFVNAQVADADDVNTNFGDLVTFLNASVVHVDNSKTLTAGTAAGSAARIDDTDTYVVFAKSGELAVTTGHPQVLRPEGTQDPGSGSVGWGDPYGCCGDRGCEQERYDRSYDPGEPCDYRHLGVCGRCDRC